MFSPNCKLFVAEVRGLSTVAPHAGVRGLKQ